MKLKAIEILNMYEALCKLADKELDLTSACAIAKNLKELATTKEVIEKKRNELILQFAQKDENGNPIQEENGIKLADAQSFLQHMDELLSSEIEISICPISQAALAEIKLSPNDFLALNSIIKEDETCTH